MNSVQIYNKIKDLAQQLMSEDETFSRADLAFELKEFGIETDSLEVSRLVYEAYEYFKQNGAIKVAFVTNDGTKLVVSEYQIHGLLTNENSAGLARLTEEHLTSTNDSLNQLQKIVNFSLTESPTSKSNVMNTIKSTITGTKGISNVQAQATGIFNAYSKLVDGYAAARSDVKTIMADFVAIREDVQKIYTTYSTRLLDVFGDSIKTVAPKMFDSDSVEFLNVEGMLQQIALEYDQLSEKCTTLIGTISENFSNSVSQSVRSYRSAGNSKGFGLAMAGITMLNHYLGAQEKNMKCQQELESLRMDIKHDATQIRADYARLASIYKTLNDLYIPKANAFYRFGNKVLSSELEQLFEAIYQDPAIKNLADERDEIINQINELQNSITDNRFNIDYYKSNIQQAKDFLESKNNEYQMAQSSKPTKPFFLLNLLTFGKLNEAYNRDLYEWNSCYFPVIREYERYKEDIKLDEDELKNHQEEEADNTQLYKEAKLKLKEYNRQIVKSLQVSGTLKHKMAQHLESIIGLLYVAKSILESKLDQRFIKTVNITNYKSTKLPADIENNIHIFTNKLRENICVDLAFAADSVTVINEQMGYGTPCAGKEIDTKEKTKKQEELQALTDAQNATIQKGLDLFEKWSILKKQQQEGQMKSNMYDILLQGIQEEFLNSMQSTDNQSAVLNETIRRINLSTTDKEVKEGLLALYAGKISLSEQDIDNFLKGNKQIEI